MVFFSRGVALRRSLSLAATAFLAANALAADAPSTSSVDRPQPRTSDESAFLSENDAAMTKMMTDMEIKPSGDLDRDFVEMMVPHHQGAIDMAQALRTDGRCVCENTRRIAVRQQSAPDVPGGFRELGLPVSGFARERNLTADFIAKKGEQLVLVAHVPVQRRGFHVQPIGQRPHRQIVEADFVE